MFRLVRFADRVSIDLKLGLTRSDLFSTNNEKAFDSLTQEGSDQ